MRDFQGEILVASEPTCFVVTYDPVTKLVCRQDLKTCSGKRTSLDIHGLTDGGFRVEIEPDIQIMRSGLGEVDEDGNFTAGAPGRGMIVVTLGDLTCTVVVTVKICGYAYWVPDEPDDPGDDPGDPGVSKFSP